MQPPQEQKLEQPSPSEPVVPQEVAETIDLATPEITEDTPQEAVADGSS